MEVGASLSCRLCKRKGGLRMSKRKRGLKYARVSALPCPEEWILKVSSVVFWNSNTDDVRTV